MKVEKTGELMGSRLENVYFATAFSRFVLFCALFDYGIGYLSQGEVTRWPPLVAHLMLIFPV